MEQSVRRVFVAALLTGGVLIWAANDLSVRLAQAFAPAETPPMPRAISLQDHFAVAEQAEVELRDGTRLRVADLLDRDVTVVLVQWSGPLSNGLWQLDLLRYQLGSREPGSVQVIPIVPDAYWTQTLGYWDIQDYPFQPARLVGMDAERRRVLRYVGSLDAGTRANPQPIVTVFSPDGTRDVQFRGAALSRRNPVVAAN